MLRKNIEPQRTQGPREKTRETRDPALCSLWLNAVPVPKRLPNQRIDVYLGQIGPKRGRLPMWTIRIALLLATSVAGVAQAQQPADMILIGARVWTGDGTAAAVRSIALAGDRIIAVGTEEEIMRHRVPATRGIYLANHFISPGFIDNHTHFQNAGALLVGVNLLDVSTEVMLVQRVREARDRLQAGAWLTGGDWGAYEAWAQGSTGTGSAVRTATFDPHRGMIDSVTPN